MDHLATVASSSSQQWPAEIGHPQAYTCNYCGIQLSSTDNLLQHIQSHNQQVSFICTYCSAAFPYPGLLQLHIQSYHHAAAIKHDHYEDAGRSTFAVCRSALSVLDNQTADDGKTMRESEEVSDFACYCVYCGEVFSSQAALDQHIVRNCGQSSNAVPTSEGLTVPPVSESQAVDSRGKQKKRNVRKKVVAALKHGEFKIAALQMHVP